NQIDNQVTMIGQNDTQISNQETLLANQTETITHLNTVIENQTEQINLLTSLLEKQENKPSELYLLSTEEKPLDVIKGSTVFEIDTQNIFMFDGEGWMDIT